MRCLRSYQETRALQDLQPKRGELPRRAGTGRWRPVEDRRLAERRLPVRPFLFREAREFRETRSRETAI
jgi:hypothetical protein